MQDVESIGRLARSSFLETKQIYQPIPANVPLFTMLFWSRNQLTGFYIMHNTQMYLNKLDHWNQKGRDGGDQLKEVRVSLKDNEKQDNTFENENIKYDGNTMK